MKITGRLFGIIQQPVIETTNWECINTLNWPQDGRGVMQLILLGHFEGPGEVKKWIDNATNHGMKVLH
jgi:hypothetical protein